jgi:hypothetical protein
MSVLHPDAIALLNIAQALICMGIAYQCFHRNCKTCKQTITAVRLSFVGLGSASVLLALWPWWPYLHDYLGAADYASAHPVAVAFESSVLAVQWLTRKHWALVVPWQYQRRGVGASVGAPLRRSTDFLNSRTAK